MCVFAFVCRVLAAISPRWDAAARPARACGAGAGAAGRAGADKTDAGRGAARPLWCALVVVQGVVGEGTWGQAGNARGGSRAEGLRQAVQSHARRHRKPVVTPGEFVFCRGG